MSEAPLSPGLYLVATPIGSARDITLRALDILRNAEVLAAEDTRTLRHLLDIHGVAVGERPLVPYHDHNGPQARPRLLGYLRDGRSVAYASEAGTPLVADPGYQLARAVIEAGLPLTGAPGPSAAIAALTLSGLPTDRFLFAGFMPSGGTQRRSFLRELKPVPATLVLYESPRRVAAALGDILTELGDRQAALCRELTKRFEEVRRGNVSTLAASVAERPPKGEIVLIVDRGREVRSEADLDAALDDALGAMSVKDAVATVSGALGLPRKTVYQAALSREKRR